jgi:type IV pilus assembly protein PilC
VPVDTAGVSTTLYGYRAVDATGEIHRGVLPGDGPDSVAERVRRMGLRPVEVRRRHLQIAQKEFTLPGFGGKKADLLALFSRQFATMTDAGTPILRCLRVLEGQANARAKHKPFGAALGMVRADIENGDQLSVALARQPDWFSDFYVSMVEAGEAAGSLPTVLDRLADATEQSSRLRKRIKSALAYPTAVGVLIALTVVAMLTFLIPTFSSIFEDLDGELPLPTRIVMGVSDLFTSYLPVIFIGGVVAVWWLRRWKRTPAGALAWDRFRLRLPVFGNLVRLAALARFSRSLAVLVDTGVPVMEGLSIAATTANNRVVSDAVNEVAHSVRNGGRLSEGMARHRIFTDVVVQMVAVGEETGALDQMLVKVADMYEVQVNSTVDSLTSLLEPLLIVAMGVVVGGMLLSVYLPMFRAISLVR